MCTGGVQSRVENEGLQVYVEGIDGVGFPDGIGQSIPKGGSGVPDCSLAIHTAWSAHLWAQEQQGETSGMGIVQRKNL